MALPAQYAVARFVYQPAEGRQQILVAYYAPEVTIPGVDFLSVQTFCDTSSNGIGGQIKGVLASDCDYIGLNLSFHDSGTVFSVTSRNAGGAGEQDADSLPNSDAVVIRKRTDNGGRSGYGRWFIGCIPETFTDDARLEEAAIGEYTDLAVALAAPITSFGETDLYPMHYSKSENTLSRIRATYVDSIIRRQDRRRLNPLI